MELLRPGWKEGTALPGIVADRDHIIKINRAVFVDVVGSLLRDVHAILLHDSNGPGIYAVCFHTGAPDCCLTTGKQAQIAFGHLAPAAIAGT